MKAVSVAKYYLLKDIQGGLYDEAKLNKSLFVTQIFYLVKTGEKLFEEDFEVYRKMPIVEGAVFPATKILACRNDDDLNLEIKEFLNTMYDYLRNISSMELDALIDEEPTLKSIRSDRFLMPMIKLEEDIEGLKKIYGKRVEEVFRKIKKS